MKVLITGANGFLGKNLQIHLSERNDIDSQCFTREHKQTELHGLLEHVDFVFHMAGVNRPKDVLEFKQDNTDLTVALCAAIEKIGRSIPVLYTSSIQAGNMDPYAQSKLEAELALKAFSEKTKAPVYLFRLPNVFGKWCKPNYNSAVATFCHNISRGLPIQINNPNATIRLVYIDDVIEKFISIMDNAVVRDIYCDIDPEYRITVGELVDRINVFKAGRESLTSERVGVGFDRALHSTYLSYLPTENFSYSLAKHTDPRGVFVEMLKTQDSGQFSYFTAHPGITRGGHYHHTKTEKFLVLKGQALFKFRNVVTDQYYEIETEGDEPTVVETVPGWTHDITNIGADEMIVMLWANEIFDHDHPDTYVYPL